MQRKKEKKLRKDGNPKRDDIKAVRGGAQPGVRDEEGSVITVYTKKKKKQDVKQSRINQRTYGGKSKSGLRKKSSSGISRRERPYSYIPGKKRERDKRGKGTHDRPDQTEECQTVLKLLT